ncbi:hypothetical protein, partial [Microbacterium sp. GbtcB4]|uniref:hypothetical protein n=1 Tax=Microbacterium sp. GbtcB4 TaxID=2824749 RepID=UPI001C2F3D8A
PGRPRERKRGVEAFWGGRIDEQGLERAAAGLRATTRERLAGLGLGRAASSTPASSPFCDQVSAPPARRGAIPPRLDA